MKTQEKLKKLRANLRSWDVASAENLRIDIDDEGLANALLLAGEAEERKLQEKEVIVWSHLVMLAIGPRGYMPSQPVSKRRLFEVMNHKKYKDLFERGMKNFISDEVPTQFMKDLYAEFKEWSIKHPRTQKY